jgi:hypothetical protein
MLRDAGVSAQAGGTGDVDAVPLKARVIARPREILQHAGKGSPGRVALSLKRCVLAAEQRRRVDCAQAVDRVKRGEQIVVGLAVELKAISHRGIDVARDLAPDLVLEDRIEIVEFSPVCGVESGGRTDSLEGNREHQQNSDAERKTAGRRPVRPGCDRVRDVVHC